MNDTAFGSARWQACWTALERHADQIRDVHLRELMAAEAGRFERCSLEVAGLHLDLSKHRATERTLELLVDLAQACGMRERIDALFAGEQVNPTEQRPALHMALRHPGHAPFPRADFDVMPGVTATRRRMAEIATAIASGRWIGFGGEPIRRVVNIGIGGSHLGPTMASEALGRWHRPGVEVEFVSNIDATALARVLERCRPRTTLFVVASKSFSTAETLTNAHSARRWLVSGAGGDESAVARHFVALSSNPERTAAFGIDPANVLGFEDWVGGRYSLWSAIGLSLCIAIGPRAFERLLAGAWAMDQHFLAAPLRHNAPVLLGLLGLWYRNFFGAATHAVLPYDVALERLPAHLQQLEMESNGKGVSLAGEPLTRLACPVIWGAAGNDGQHAFYQKLHQGGELVPSDFIVPVRGQSPLPGHEHGVLANALAQSQALMLGRSEAEVRERLREDGLTGGALEAAVPHRVLPGNQPSTTILYRRLTPEILGALVALYEQKVFAQGVLWDVNSFDQWGVELGKEIAAGLEPEIGKAPAAGAHDPSTSGLLGWIHRLEWGES